MLAKPYGHFPYDISNSTNVLFDSIKFDSDIGIEHGRRLRMSLPEAHTKLVTGYAKVADISEDNLRSMMHRGMLYDLS